MPSCQYFDPDEGDRYICPNVATREVQLELGGSVEREVLRHYFCEEHFKKLNKGVLKVRKNAPDLVVKVLNVRSI